MWLGRLDAAPLFHLSAVPADWMGVAGGAVAGYLAITFVFYWWHRWRHQSAPLWRWFHQVHHSQRRIEIITSFYKRTYNYGDLPLWDVLFGASRNPRDWRAACGFGPAGEERLAEMLCGVDVNAPAPSAGAAQ